MTGENRVRLEAGTRLEVAVQPLVRLQGSLDRYEVAPVFLERHTLVERVDYIVPLTEYLLKVKNKTIFK